MIVQYLGRLLVGLEQPVHLLLHFLLLRLQLALVPGLADALLRGGLAGRGGPALALLARRRRCRGLLVVLDEAEELGHGNHRPQPLPGLAVVDRVVLAARRCLRHLAGKVSGLLALA